MCCDGGKLAVGNLRNVPNEFIDLARNFPDTMWKIPVDNRLTITCEWVMKTKMEHEIKKRYILMKSCGWKMCHKMTWKYKTNDTVKSVV